MSELPELEILRSQLDRDLAGKKVKTVEVTVPAVVKRNGNKKQFGSRLDGVKLGSTTRRGTWLVIGLEESKHLVIHLGPGASLARVQAKEAVEKGTAATITLTQTGQLRLIDPQKHSEMAVVDDDELAALTEGETGFDLAGDAISWTTFGERLLRQKAKLKTVLMDPTFLVGIGTMYSDEILFESGLRYDRAPQSLATQEIRRLYRATVEIIHEAIKHGGAAGYFVDAQGRPGGYQLAVYGRDGELSPRARGAITKVRFGSGSTYLCEQTQM